MKDGLRYVRNSTNLKTITLIGFIAAFLGLPLLTFLPVVAKDVFQQDVGLYTRMMTTSGIGAVCGAMVVAWLGRHEHMGRMLLIMLGAFGCAMTAFALSPDVRLSTIDPVLHRRAAGDVLLADDLTGAADRAAGAARPGRQHLHGGVPRRLTAGRAGQRLADHAGGIGADDAGDERRRAGAGGELLPATRARNQGCWTGPDPSGPAGPAGTLLDLRRTNRTGTFPGE